MNRRNPSERRRRYASAAIVSATILALVPLGAHPAMAAVEGGRSIEVFTGSNLVSLTSYPTRTDVKVEVVRQGFVIGSAVKQTDATGMIEMNHVGGTDCFDGPTSPDIEPGDMLRTRIMPDGPVDTSVVRGVFIESFETNADSITVTGQVTMQGPAAVVPGSDVLELRINKDSAWDVNDREGRSDRRVDIGPDVQADGSWSVTLPASSADIADVEAGNEHFLEWAAGAAAGEEEEEFPPELTVWDAPEGEALDCPPLQQGPTAPQLAAAQDSGTVGDNVTNQSVGLAFGGLTGEAGPEAAVTLFVDDEETAAGRADAEGVYSFPGVSLPARAAPYALRVRAQSDGPFFDSADRMVTVDNTDPAVRLRRFGPKRLRLKGRERVHAVYRIGEAALLQARVQRRLPNRVRTVKTFADRSITRPQRAIYNWNGRNEVRRNVRPGRYRMLLTATDRAGNARTHVRWFRVVMADAPSRPRIRRAFWGARGGRNTAVATWARPLTNNGARVTGYRVKALRLRPNGTVAAQRASKMLRPRARSHQMRLRPGRYRFRVRAVNTAGASRWSARSNWVRSR